MMSKLKTEKHNEARLRLISDIFFELRFARGETQQQVSNGISNLHRNTISRIESTNPLNLISLFKLADYYEIPISELFSHIE